MLWAFSTSVLQASNGHSSLIELGGGLCSCTFSGGSILLSSPCALQLCKKRTSRDLGNEQRFENSSFFTVVRHPSEAVNVEITSHQSVCVYKEISDTLYQLTPMFAEALEMISNGHVKIY